MKSKNACGEAETRQERDDSGLYQDLWSGGKPIAWGWLDWGECEGEGGVRARAKACGVDSLESFAHRATHTKAEEFGLCVWGCDSGKQ